MCSLFLSPFRFYNDSFVVIPEEPCEGAAELCDLIDKHGLSLLRIICRPCTRVPLVDVSRLNFWVNFLVSFPSVRCPVLPVFVSFDVLEEQFFIAKLTRHKLSVKHDIGDVF